MNSPEEQLVMSVPTLTLASARRFAALAMEEAARRDCQIVVAVVDRSATTIILERMDGAEIAALDVALAKASTAAKCKTSTSQLGQVLSEGRTGLLAIDGLLPIEGGVPLIYGDNVVGAIGISGAAPEVDGLIANHVSDAFVNAA